MAGIPESILDEIRSRTDLVALVSEHVALKRSGRGFTGLCPFHNEKTPSFHVDPERAFFHCFGCGAGGNAFTFLMRVSGITFPEAVRALAVRTGVELPDRKESGVHDRLADANALARELFERVLWESKLGQPGRDYLAQRGIDEATARHFRLGFAPAISWLEKLTARGVSEPELHQLGLAGASRRGPGSFPMFRDRLMFPICDLSGRVIAFGGRAIVAGQQPKYLNSPETPLFRKGHHLFALREARDAIRAAGQIVLVEGYLDAIALWTAGIRNAVGILGTALTADQLRLGRRFAEDLVLCFDDDTAGRRAALRAFPLCVNDAEIWPRAVFLPPGEDPDSYVRARGAEAMRAQIAAGTSLLDVYLDELVGAGAGPAATTRAAAKMARLLAPIRDALIRDRIVRGVAGRFGVSEAAFLAAVAAADAPPDRAAPPAANATAPRFGAMGLRSGATGPRAVGAGRKLGISGEAELVELAIYDAAIAERIEREGVLGEFEDAGLRAVAEDVLARRRSSDLFDPAALLAELPRGLADRVARRLVAGLDAEELRRAGEEWFARREQRLARAGRRALIARLRVAESRSDTAEAARVLEELHRSAQQVAGAAADPAPADLRRQE